MYASWNGRRCGSYGSPSASSSSTGRGPQSCYWTGGPRSCATLSRPNAPRFCCLYRSYLSSAYPSTTVCSRWCRGCAPTVNRFTNRRTPLYSSGCGARGSYLSSHTRSIIGQGRGWSSSLRPHLRLSLDRSSRRTWRGQCLSCFPRFTGHRSMRSARNWYRYSSGNTKSGRGRRFQCMGTNRCSFLTGLRLCSALFSSRGLSRHGSKPSRSYSCYTLSYMGLIDLWSQLFLGSRRRRRNKSSYCYAGGGSLPYAYC